MDRDDLIVQLTTLQTGYLTLQTAVDRLGDRLKTLEEAERSWAIWFAKVGMLPVVGSLALTIVSAWISLQTTDKATAMLEATTKIEKALSKAR